MLRTGYIIAVTAAVVPLGAVHGPVIAVCCLLFAGIAAASALRPLRPELRPTVFWATGIAGLFVGWALVQTLPVLGISPAWTEAAEVVGDVRGALSVAPHMGFSGLPSLLIPLIAFLSGIVLFGDDGGARILLWTAAWLALCGALLGIYEYTMSPTQLLFQPRLHRMDAVTAYFVNRNTAATFLGVGAVVWAALLLGRIKKLGTSGLKRILLNSDRGSSRDVIHVTSLLLAFLAVTVALFLTKSRAGISASLAGLLVVTLSITQNQSHGAPIRSRLLPAAIAASFVVAIALVYGSPLLFRLSTTDASDDLRWCFFSDMIAAIRDKPFTGFGYGTLEYVYPSYRNPSCMPLQLVLDRGHNGYLELAMGMGVASLTVLAAAAAYLMFTFKRGISLRRGMRFAPSAALGTLTVVILHTAFDFSLQILGIAVYTATIFAAGVVASKAALLRRRQSHQPSKTTLSAAST